MEMPGLIISGLAGERSPRSPGKSSVSSWGGRGWGSTVPWAALAQSFLDPLQGRRPASPIAQTPQTRNADGTELRLPEGVASVQPALARTCRAGDARRALVSGLGWQEGLHGAGGNPSLMTAPLQSRPPPPNFLFLCPFFPPDPHPPGHQPSRCRPGAGPHPPHVAAGPVASSWSSCRLWPTRGPETGRGKDPMVAGQGRWTPYIYTRGRGLSTGLGTSPEGLTVLLCDPVPHL